MDSFIHVYYVYKKSIISAEKHSPGHNLLEHGLILSGINKPLILLFQKAWISTKLQPMTI